MGGGFCSGFSSFGFLDSSPLRAEGLGFYACFKGVEFSVLGSLSGLEL